MKPYPKYFEKIRIRPDKDAELKRVATPELGTLTRVIAEAGG